ncbi:hypothetical protein PG997_003152 [Apiospora hydei]|uniref:Uncharacterized protein n=1 Tax=Apiospora hydei TaxID=1337664 RepID=A0ABR1WYF2_9PEZI
MTSLSEISSSSDMTSLSDMTSVYTKTPLSERSVWCLEEVDPDELENAVWVLYEELKLKDIVALATVKLKYEKRRQRIPKWLGPLSRAMLDPSRSANMRSWRASSSASAAARYWSS